MELTDQGQREAALVGDSLSVWTFESVYASPLLRASETARIAGHVTALDDDLMEWDYGDLEGMTHTEITADRPGWSKWIAEVPGGEQVADVGDRADHFLARIDGSSGDTVVFGHGHMLAILIARWVGLPALEGRRFPLATATVTVLATKRDDRVIEQLNQSCAS